MLVLHANWMNGALHIWGESLSAYLAASQFPHGGDHSSADSSIASFSSSRGATTQAARTQQATAHATAAISTAEPESTFHPFACSPDELTEALRSRLKEDELAGDCKFDHGVLQLRLPVDENGPQASDRLMRRVGAREGSADPWLAEIEAPSIVVPNDRALLVLSRLEQHEPHSEIELGQSLRFWISVAHLALQLLEDQRFIPSLVHLREGGARGAWQPWIQDEDARARIGFLLRAFPPSARAAIDDHEHRAWPILQEALRKWTDATVRAALMAEQFADALEGRQASDDPHVAWLAGLLDAQHDLPVSNEAAIHLLRDVELWIGRLQDAQQRRPLRLCLKLNEPPPSTTDTSGDAAIWELTFHLQSPDDSSALYSAAEIWNQGPAMTSSSAVGSRGSQAQELLLAELGRASRVYPALEDALAEKHPTSLRLTTAQAYEFLREMQSLLSESGIKVIVPEWWNQPMGRLAARLHVESPSTESIAAEHGSTPTSSILGLNSLVKFNWQVAIGDQPLSMEEFQSLSRQTSPLVQMRGRWVEISPEHLKEAREFLEQSPSGEITLLQAIHIAHGADAQMRGLTVHGMDATGWVADLLAASSDEQRMPLLEQPQGFHGTLRPYQKSGLSWLAFLDRFGLGTCLADDMGLGKTIQLIALLLHERERSAGSDPETGQHSIGPTLLIVPTSVIANWVRELERFAPTLSAHVHHGPERASGDEFVETALKHDVVITTYPLVSRDQETLKRVQWHRVALDEAQYIKNPPTKQTTAIRSLHAPRRMALTGTPVENRLSELWSIMEFCNPGYLGPATDFRRRFSIPIERHHNRLQGDRLRQIVRPFVLRRVKTDPKIIDDLPPLTETKEFATLTVEQATMYQQTVSAMLNQVDRSAGIQRRGLVLATLVKLKQICNHPEQASGAKTATITSETIDTAPDSDDSASVELGKLDIDPSRLSSRSGKAKRLMTMLEEVIASGEKALVFTQFRQMGHLLTAMIQSDLDCEAIFLHGGTPANKRQSLIDRFQSDHGGAPIFVLSLKAGGLGLNLTAANHVFHYDRWWNPAVENQATDRAFRIGQMRAVQVHKFVCLGTLEERIDQMIEQKTELAQNIIGSGEQWLTELSTSQLQDLLMLRPSAMEVES